jgi:kynureninase
LLVTLQFPGGQVAVGLFDGVLHVIDADLPRGQLVRVHLHANGIIVDWREPDVIRAAPTPMYNRHIDCLRFVLAVRDWAAREGGA